MLRGDFYVNIIRHRETRVSHRLRCLIFWLSKMSQVSQMPIRVNMVQ